MAKVTGIGGVFIKAKDPKRLAAWYSKHLGLDMDEGGVALRWKDGATKACPGSTVFSLFPADTTYFAPSRKAAMFNFRVDDLDGLLAKLRKAGVEVEGHTVETAEGRFGWVMDPEGNRVELWEPGKGW